MDTLLAKARAVKPTRSKKPDKQLAELAVAWATDELTLNQVAAAFNRRGSAMYASLAGGLRDAVRLGLLAVPRRKKVAA